MTFYTSREITNLPEYITNVIFDDIRDIELL